ncbi:MAG: cysteine synthase family protein [Ignavibacteriae bacterium]|nr:cysteine synthase family protein [Ignavibacteriota bacterium]MCB9209592.1 cysteine synthase family protein [Ignavibacteriales bacterium]
MKIKNNLSELIGNTPMLKIKTERADWEIFLKLEYFNPAGSFKDRTAQALMNAAEKSGKLKKGMTLFESSSGNTAKALAMLSAARGYKFVAIVDKHAPADKLNAIRAYGGELYFCADDENSKGGHLVDVRRNLAKKLAKECGGINLDQYDNPENPQGFYDTLGKEIMEQVPDLNILMGTVGTGSSLSGAGRYIKEYTDAQIIALEPKGSSHFSPHGHGYFISGPGYPVGAILPKNIDTSLFDKNDYVSDSEAFNTMRFFAHHKGLLLGDSSGMLLYYSMKYIKDTPKSNEIKKMVLIIGDSGESYLAHAFNDGWMIKNELINKQIINDLSEFYI